MQTCPKCGYEYPSHIHSGCPNCKMLEERLGRSSKEPMVKWMYPDDEVIFCPSCGAYWVCDHKQRLLDFFEKEVNDLMEKNARVAFEATMDTMLHGTPIQDAVDKVMNKWLPTS